VVTDRLIRLTTALAVVAVAGVAAIISYQHAYELVTSYGETGLTARLLPFTVDGLIWAASMVVLDASRRNQGGANLAHGLSHDRIGALVGAWPALALVDSFELLMLLIRSAHRVSPEVTPGPEVPVADQDVPGSAAFVERAVRAQHNAGHSQRAIARELSIDRRQVKRIIDANHAA
jgi:hypothetical protein